jgi:hypothetical protein
MLKNFKRKFTSKSGLSIMLALLVFLMAALVGTTILSAATVSSGAANTVQQDEVDVRLLESGANLIKEAVCSDTYTFKNDGSDDVAPSGSVTIDTMTKNLAILVHKGETAKATTSFTIKVGTSGTPVKCTVKMDSLYNVSAKLTMTNSTHSGKVTVSAATVEDSGQNSSIVSWSDEAEISVK